MEKREWQRVQVNVLAKCRRVEEATYHQIRLTDMHHQGCAFNADAEFGKGQEIRIVVDMPVLGSLYLVGVVAWTASIGGHMPYRAGVRFLVNDPVAIENTSKVYSYLMSRS